MVKRFRINCAAALPVDPSERKALFIAFLCCLLFIAFVASIRRPRAPVRRYVATDLTPSDPPKKFYVEEPVVRDLRGKPNVPENFELVDFANRPYGPYKFSDGNVINLTLNDGESHILNKPYAGWFSLKDVYYSDLTGDGNEEAIVVLSHVMCREACDEKSHLIYVYTGRNGNLRTLWQYETGNNVNGCSLKSLTVDGKQIVMELFGRCPKEGVDYAFPGKGTIEDLTYVLFRFDGRTFAQQQIQFITMPAKRLKDYEPEIRIYEPSQKMPKVRRMSS